MSLINLDEKLSEKQRQATYGVGFLGVAVAILAQAFGWASGEDVNQIVDLVSMVGSLLGLGATAVVRNVLKNQRENGAIIGGAKLPTIEVPVEVPVPIELSPLEHITQAVEAASAIDKGIKDGLGQLTAITGGLINIPGVLAMTPDLPGKLDDLVRGAGERFKTS